ncbi:hypothetical protein D3C87_1580570 [compost metagenome]
MGALVPIASARIEVRWHVGVRADDKATLVAAQKYSHESSSHHILLEQLGYVAHIRVQRDVLGKVFNQQAASVQPSLNVVGGHASHFLQVVVQILADGITLHIVVVQREGGEGDSDDEGGSKQNLMTKAQIFIHGLEFR